MPSGACKLVLIFSFLTLSCSSPNLSPPHSGVRSPSSLCQPNSAEASSVASFASDPSDAEKKRVQLMNAEVQTYMRASELTHDFDAMLDAHIPLTKIYQSDVYMQLLATQQIQKKYHEELEGYFAYRVREIAGAEPTNEERMVAIDRVMSRCQQEFQRIVSAKPESAYAKLALLDIQEDLEDIKNFNSICDSVPSEESPAESSKKLTQESLSDRFKKHGAKVREILKSAPVIKNAHKAFAPTVSEPGVDVGTMIQNSAQEIRDQTRAPNGRTPQADLNIEPSAGPNGNMFGDKFPAKTWALTFDDGPGSTTHLVLDNLKKHNMKATFFLISQNLRNSAFQQVAKQTHLDGHPQECHSMTHPQIPKLDEAGRKREIFGAKEVYTDFFSTQPGDTTPLFFRLPYGAGVSVPSVRQMIADAKMIHVYWNVDTLDWQDHNPQSILARTIKQMQQAGRGIILFHDIHPQSVVASELLMHYLEDPANHIRLVTIPEITDEMNRNLQNAPSPKSTATPRFLPTKPSIKTLKNSSSQQAQKPAPEANQGD